MEEKDMIRIFLKPLFIEDFSSKNPELAHKVEINSNWKGR